MSTTTSVPEAGPPGQPGQPPAEPAPTSFTESILDNLPAWTVVAAGIAFLYIVWATLEILGRYIAGGLPKVTP